MHRKSPNFLPRLNNLLVIDPEQRCLRQHNASRPCNLALYTHRSVHTLHSVLQKIGYNLPCPSSSEMFTATSCGLHLLEKLGFVFPILLLLASQVDVTCTVSTALAVSLSLSRFNSLLLRAVYRFSTTKLQDQQYASLGRITIKLMTPIPLRRSFSQFQLQ